MGGAAFAGDGLPRIGKTRAVAETAAFATAAPVASWMEPIKLPFSYCALALMPHNAIKRPAKRRVLRITCKFLMGATVQGFVGNFCEILVNAL